jgi:Zeta toxin
MDYDTTEQVRLMAATEPPQRPAPTSDRSAWGAPWRAVKAAAGEALGSTADVLKGFGAASAMALEADPIARAAVGERALREGAAEGRRQIDTDEALTSEGVGRAFRNVAAEQRPDPVTASTAENIVFGVVRPVAKLVIGGVVAGPFGIAGASLEEGFTQSEELRQQGVDFGTRTTVGALTAGANAAGAAMPMAGPTLKATAGLYLAGGPGAFIAQQAATSKILEHAGYDEIAKQYDPLDPTGLALSALIPLPFAAHGVARNIRAGKAAKAAPDAAAAPVAETPAPRMPTEVVDAAMVHNLTLRQDVHEAGALKPESAPIPRADILPAGGRAIEGAFANKLAGDFKAAADEYAQRPDSMGGKVLNTDIARELSPDYLADRTRSAAVHEPASWFIKRLYEQKLAQIKPGDEVAFSSGGTGAGKTTAIESLGLDANAALVYDTNMNSLNSAVSKIEQALQAGATVQILHVQRDAVEALVKGALPRAMRQAEEFGTGRTVPLVEHAKTHRGAAEVIQQIAERYKDDSRVNITIVDNTRGKGGARVADLDFVRSFDYNGLEGRLHEALKQERDAGRISGDVFRGTEGAAEAGLPTPVGRAGGGGSEPQGAGPGASPGAEGGVTGSSPKSFATTLQQLQQGLASPEAAVTDPLARSILDRLSALDQEGGGAMPVLIGEDGKAIAAADALAAVRKLAAEGTDTELGSLDADLVRVAAGCALSLGAA